MRFQRLIGRSKWALNYYITQSRQKSRQLSGVQGSWSGSYSRDVVGKATPGRGGPREPQWSLGTREVADKMQ